MSAEDAWKWRIGVLHGIGECCWQTDGRLIRKITKIIWQSHPIPSMSFVKHLVGGAMLCAAEVTKGQSVVFECMPDQELIDSCNSCWGMGSGILRPAGSSMPKLLR